ncbi:MAG: NAD(P)H-dependent glycerol-3-phosphate dehydrogenase [Inquilinaceae bacterium]
MTDVHRIAVLGGGAWGTALAQAAIRAGRAVTLWARDAALIDTIARTRENPTYLPGIPLDPAIRATADLEDALSGADAVLLAAPAQHTRTLAAALTATDAPLVLCAKGFETATGATMTQAVGEVRPNARLAVLSGPSFAHEVARGRPTAVTLASADPALGEALSRALGGGAFRPYWTDDVTGVEIGGAVKNVLAIAAGAVMGRGLGENARAALITRGLAEMMRLGAAMGARPETLMGLSGLGDLVLTATSPASRNTSLGMALGQGRTLADILAGRRSVSEGVHTAGAVVRLARTHGIDMPISGAVDAVLSGGADIDATVRALLDRPLKAER